jgi:hypothetical protein
MGSTYALRKDMVSVDRTAVGKPYGKRALRKIKSRWEDNITMRVYIKATEYEGVGWIQLADHGVSDGLLKKEITLQVQ